MDRQPLSAPTTPRKKRVVDRYIPNREGVNLHAAYCLVDDPSSSARPSSSSGKWLTSGSSEDGNGTYARLLKSELFGDHVPSAVPDEVVGSADQPERTQSLPSTPRKPLNKNVFSFSPSRKSIRKHTTDTLSSSPMRPESQKLLLSTKKPARNIPKTAYKVLDAPELADDFYLNLVDWGSQNKLAVGLGSTVYIWDAYTADVADLCTLTDDYICSVSWIKDGSHLAIGTGKGPVQIWDVEQLTRVRTMDGHKDRASSLSWNSHILTSGSRDCTILHRDVRIPEPYVARLSMHTDGISGLCWNTEQGLLASGGNDNRLMIWEGLSTVPLYRFSGHEAAIKALAWSPHQRGLLASGGGSNDRHIRFWNTQIGEALHSVDTGSQVCNLAWSTTVRELVSTHGYTENNIIIWKYPSMQQVAALKGHSYRVLYLSMSPDGKTIVTGAGDETLRLWSVFEEEKRRKELSTFDLSRLLR